MHSLILIASLVILSACSTLSYFSSDSESSAVDKPAPDAKSVALPKPSSTEELELQIARLTSRIDELETQVVRQKERGKIIEKGLLLGLIPDELKSENMVEGRRPDAIDHPKTQLSAVKLLELKASSEPKNEGSNDRDLYKKMIQEAQDKFNRANYGQAILAYNEVAAKFDDRITEGSHHYWIGLSWFYLKEFKLAEESFQALRSRYPASPWTHHSEFYIAKVELSRGFRQRALEQFQKILDENPSRDLGEMAQFEIERMKDKL